MNNEEKPAQPGNAPVQTSANKKNQKQARLFLVIITIIALFCIFAGIIFLFSFGFMHSSLSKAKDISFSEFLSSDLRSRETERKYQDKKFKFYFTLTQEPDFFRSTSFHGKLYDSYHNEWGEDTYENCTFRSIDKSKLKVGQTYCLDGIFSYSVIHGLGIPDSGLITLDIDVVKLEDASEQEKSPGNIISNFAIEGKWKNVGDTSCAQMQIGSITSFDGEHCNVYSPRDTYAFYSSDGTYHLDCTSFFAGDSMHFTVNIIDNDNIELVYTTGTVVKLTRVG